MKTLNEGKLNIWNNNRISSLMMKNYRWATSLRRRHKTEVLKQRKMNTDNHRGKMKMKMMIWNNNRLMSSSPILKRHKNNNKKMLVTRISDLPEEVLTEVLVRLSVKDILACVCVQKSWHSLIKTRMFITLYSNYRQKKISSSSNPPNYNTYLLFLDEYNIYELREDDIQCEKYLKLKYLPDQIQFIRFHSRLVSNGLICIFKCTYSTDHDIYLWNPLIQKYKTLPNSPHPPTWTQWKAVAFGFLPEINDYVVVYMVKYGLDNKPHPHYVITCVYSLNTNYWRKITHENVPDVGHVNRHESFFVNGVAVWGGHNSQEKRIITCFDTKTDVMREILLPECVNNNSCYPTVHTFGESIICSARNRSSYNEVDMWVLKGDIMNEILWEKKVTVKFPGSSVVHVLGLRNNGDLILSNSHYMISYNLDSYKSYHLWESWTPTSHGNPSRMGLPFDVTPFVESLTLLHID